MIKICVVHFTATQGGGTKSFVDLLLMLHPHYHVIACIPWEANKLRFELESLGLEVVRIRSQIPYIPYYSGSAPLFSPRMINSFFTLFHKRKFAEELMELTPDVVIYNSVVSIMSVTALPKTIVKICFVRETFRKGLISRIFFKTLNDNFSGVCFLAEHERKAAALNNPASIIIPDCLDPRLISRIETVEARKMEEIEEDDFVVLFLGGLSPLKGTHIVLKAISTLKPDYKLIISGNFDEKRLMIGSILRRWYSPRYLYYMFSVRKYYKMLKYNKKVKLTGYRKDISSLMCAADVVVFPSIKAHQPRPCIEAGEYSVPVVLSDFEATKEYFINGHNAVTFKPKSSKALAEALVSLKKNPEHAKEMGHNNYEMTRENHNFFLTNERLLDFLDLCIGRKNY